MSYNYTDVLGMIGNCRAVVITLNDNTQKMCKLLCLNEITGVKVIFTEDNKEGVISLSKITNIMQLSY